MLGGSWEAGYQRAGKQAKQAKQAEQAKSAHQSAASVQPPPTGLSIPFQSVPEQPACSDSVPFRSIPFRFHSGCSACLSGVQLSSLSQLKSQQLVQHQRLQQLAQRAAHGPALALGLWASTGS